MKLEQKSVEEFYNSIDEHDLIIGKKKIMRLIRGERHGQIRHLQEY